MDAVWMPVLIAGSSAIGAAVGSACKSIADFALGRQKAMLSQLEMACLRISELEKSRAELEAQSNAHLAAIATLRVERAHMEDALSRERELRVSDKAELQEQMEESALALNGKIEHLESQREELELEVAAQAEQIAALSDQLQSVGITPAAKKPRQRNGKGQFQ